MQSIYTSRRYKIWCQPATHAHLSYAADCLKMVDPALSLSAYFDACNHGVAKGFAPSTYRMSREALIRFVAKQLRNNAVGHLCTRHGILPASKHELATFIGGRCLYEHPMFVQSRTKNGGACESIRTQWYSAVAVDNGVDDDDDEVASGYISASSS